MWVYFDFLDKNMVPQPFCIKNMNANIKSHHIDSTIRPCFIHTKVYPEFTQQQTHVLELTWQETQRCGKTTVVETTPLCSYVRNLSSISSNQTFLITLINPSLISDLAIEFSIQQLQTFNIARLTVILQTPQHKRSSTPFIFHFWLVCSLVSLHFPTCLKVLKVDLFLGLKRPRMCGVWPRT